MRPNFRSVLLASAAMFALAAPALGESYFFRTKPLVDPPQPFAFVASAAATPGVTVASAPSRVKGYGGKTASVSGGEYQVCSVADCSDQGTAWRTAPTANLPAEFHARLRVAAASFGSTSAATLAVGGTSASFAVSSRAADVDPDPITIAETKDATPSSSTTSGIYRLTDHDGITVSSSSGATLRVCADAACNSSGGWVSSSAAAKDSYVQLQTTSPAAGQTASVTLTYGPRTAVWSVTSKSAQPVPGTYFLGTPTKTVNTRQLAFVSAPIGTTFQTVPQYAAWCRSQGFEPKKSSDTYFNTTASSELYSSTEYVSTTACMFVDANNLAVDMKNTRNYGLPTGTWLRVIDEGCGDSFSGNQGQGIETGSAIVLDANNTSYTFENYRFGGGAPNRGTAKTVNVQDPAVVVCQMK